MLGSAGLGTIGLGRSRVRRGNVLLSLAAGTYTLSGQSVGLGRRITVEPAADAYALTGRAVNMYLIGASPPAFDIVDGGWTTDSGGTDLYAAIDEVTADDNDFIQSPTLDLGESATAEVGIQDMADPQANFGHRVRARFRKANVSGSRPIDFTIRLKEGATVVAEWTYPAVSTDWVAVDEELTTAEADSITDYGDLSFEFVAEGVA